jgi:RNA polymerase-binding transcription factor DksA
MDINGGEPDNSEPLRHLLDARRRQLTEDLRILKARIREHGSQTALAKEPDDRDPTDLDVVLLDIANATLRRVDQAYARLDEGEYGICAVCRRPIAEVRLRALPFAVCCQRCEAAREGTQAPKPDLQPGRKNAWADWSPADWRSHHGER